MGEQEQSLPLVPAIVVSPEAMAEILEAIQNPPAPSQRMRELAERYKREVVER